LAQYPSIVLLIYARNDHHFLTCLNTFQRLFGFTIVRSCRRSLFITSDPVKESINCQLKLGSVESGQRIVRVSWTAWLSELMRDVCVRCASRMTHAIDDSCHRYCESYVRLFINNGTYTTGQKFV
jgi:hypothetical protein